MLDFSACTWVSGLEMIKLIEEIDLPTTNGLLPYWLMLTSAAGIYMAVGNVLHPLHNRIIYTATPDQGTHSLSSPSQQGPVGLLAESYDVGTDHCRSYTARGTNIWYMDADDGARANLLCIQSRPTVVRPPFSRVVVHDWY